MDSDDTNIKALSPEDFGVAGKVACACVLGLILMGVLLFVPTSTELNCSRTNQSLNSDIVTCELIHHTVLQTMASIKINQPAAVDIEISKGKRANRTYTAELRIKDKNYTLSLLSSADSNRVYKLKREINHFLLHSSEKEFHRTFHR